MTGAFTSGTQSSVITWRQQRRDGMSCDFPQMQESRRRAAREIGQVGFPRDARSRRTQLEVHRAPAGREKYAQSVVWEMVRTAWRPRLGRQTANRLGGVLAITLED